MSYAVLVVEDDIAAVAVAGVLRDDDLAVIRGIDRRAFVHGEVHAAVQASPAVLECRGERVAVQRRGKFSGADADIARADYILRSMYVPAGKHTIEMRFDPKSLHVTEGIAYAALALMVIGIMILVIVYRKKLRSR